MYHCHAGQSVHLTAPVPAHVCGRDRLITWKGGRNYGADTYGEVRECNDLGQPAANRATSLCITGHLRTSAYIWEVHDAGLPGL